MHPASAKRILEVLPHDAVVLDIGGWAVPFPRADWMMDLGSYETRGEWGRDGPAEEERFSAETWITRDICAREPYPFEDKSLDFVICSQTLEDVRDPVFVCQEMMRIAKAGYIEVPSRLVEQSPGVQGEWSGYGHHHWLVDVADAGITFTFKHHVIHHRPELHFPHGFANDLPEEDRIQTLWWQDRFDCTEQVFLEPAELDAYLSGFVERHGGSAAQEEPAGRGRIGKLLRGTR